MRKLVIAYSILAIGTFGWLRGSFGLLPSLLASLLASILISAPATFAWRLVGTDRSVKGREYACLAVVTTTVFIVSEWCDTGMNRHAVFEREIHAFQKRIFTMPEYKDVDVSYTHRKGGRVYLHGTVMTQASHECLLQTIERMVCNNNSG